MTLVQNKSQKGVLGECNCCPVLLDVKSLSLFGVSGQAESLQFVEDLPTGAVKQTRIHKVNARAALSLMELPANARLNQSIHELGLPGVDLEQLGQGSRNVSSFRVSPLNGAC